MKVCCNNINECKIQYLFLAFTLKKKIAHTHQGQSRKKKDKTHEKVQESQHGLKKQTVLVIGDSILNGMLEKGLIKEHKLKVDNNPESTGKKNNKQFSQVFEIKSRRLGVPHRNKQSC